MNTTFDVLVITLSSLLGILLILLIYIAVRLKKLIDAVQHVVAKGEQVVDSAESAAEMFKKVAGPLGFLRSITTIVETISKHKRKEK